MHAFLKQKDPQLDRLKQRYFEEASSHPKSAYKPSDTRFSHYSDVEEFIAKEQRRKQVLSLRQRVSQAFDRFFLIKLGDKSVYFWHSRRFEELAYMHVPRFVFLAGSIYVIYTISLRQRQAQNWRQGVKSHRQEAVEQQLRQIEEVLRPKENHFEPGQQVEFDPKYAGDQFKYLYEREERDLQDKLFQLYEEINEEQEEGYGYEVDERPSNPAATFNLSQKQ